MREVCAIARRVARAERGLLCSGFNDHLPLLNSDDLTRSGNVWVAAEAGGRLEPDFIKLEVAFETARSEHADTALVVVAQHRGLVCLPHDMHRWGSAGLVYELAKRQAERLGDREGDGEGRDSPRNARSG